ncbi:hypothetical protein [Polymorphobacter fuscus]|uniref:Uncharacterized protein n=1 Tax=Sandarakinorhabdus fusca TaxID=1439888 RepID=A0A7C9GQ31_9SPHN|nr:hypothetical protein [Polymorphobacter fuscus]KAB7645553.1 hypothetical protein F9290_12090 [Polymorphobacter fuscus]MQT17997.1 hypothetical protein [Polymorphobacter fuscus]NJC08625.1 hypothetical protein [Polymorphobacter fuscus]
MAAHIAGPARYGVLQGIEVDFRNSQIPPDWEPYAWWCVWDGGRTRPSLLFPNEAAFGLAHLRDAKGLADDTAEPILLQPGDKISVDRVETEKTDNRFHHPHDAETKLVFLKVVRADGTQELPPVPLPFYGTSRMLRGAKRSNFDNIVERAIASASMGADNPADAWDNPYVDWWSKPLAVHAASEAREAHRAYWELHSKLGADSGGLLMAHVRQLANSAALAGFLMAKAEAEKPERMAAPIFSAGQKGADAVRRDDWRDKARALWIEHPTATVNFVAVRIAEGTEDEVRSIARAIKSLAPASSRTNTRTKRKPDSPAGRP